MFYNCCDKAEAFEWMGIWNWWIFVFQKKKKIEIIQTGFRLNQEGRISLKKYYESTDPNSLFQHKGYSIKYETIRRTKLYQQFKPSNN